MGPERDDRHTTWPSGGQFVQLGQQGAMTQVDAVKIAKSDGTVWERP
jgi:hypothetical protein